MKRTVKKVFITLAVLVLLGLIGGVIYAAVVMGAASFDAAKLPARENFAVYSFAGDEVLSGNYVKSEEISPKLKDAIVAIEDKRFYKHHGLDYLRIGKAIVTNITRAGFYEGGSTISQQLIKNTHLTSKKSINRKLQEVKLAKELEKNFSKDEILEMYLNIIYLGDGVTGAGMASRRYFDKNCLDLTLAEAALIAGITQNPKKFSPITNLENSLIRQKTVLNEMLEQGKITAEEHEEAAKEEIIIQNRRSENESYLKSAVAEAAEILGMTVEEMQAAGFKVFTYLDENLQGSVSDFVSHPSFAANAERLPANKVFLLAETESAGVKAFFNDTNFAETALRRQPASLIKPAFTYAAALEGGKFTENSLTADMPASFGGYTPKNYQEKYHEQITLKAAFSSSSNIAALHVTEEVGLKTCMETAKKLGFTFAEEDYSLASALGGLTNGSTMTEIASSYAAIASGGAFKKVSFIKNIVDKDGKLVYSHESAEKTRAISEKTANTLKNMMEETVKSGTAVKLSTCPFQVAAKTGTAGATDAWCAAVTSDFTALTWYGTADPQAQGLLPPTLTGGGLPTLLMKFVLENVE